MTRRLSPLCLLFFFAVASSSAAEVDYLRDVKPILTKHCYACHGAWKQNAGLRLDTGAAIRKGGESGPAVKAANSSESLLIGVLTGAVGFRMPPANEGTPLTLEEIAIVKQWIDSGASSPTVEQPAVDPRSYWSYQTVRRPKIPVDVEHSNWPRAAVDSFIAAKHLEHGLTPRPDAAKETQLRRLYLDLIGLPPTRDELREFLKDDRPDAMHRIVDKLLANPLYGQRWGRHWMDVWRYSDWYGSRGGNEMRYSQRHIWRWRDWIIESLNADVGYNVMVMQMLAGDELAPGNADIVRATGFLARNWYKFDRNVWMFETVEQSCQAFLGLTMKCARCHDHKFDPITQRDYYQYRAFFEPHDVRTDPVSTNLETEKDATLGQVLKVGVSYVYDKQVEVPTYLFARGDSRSPQKDQVLLPAVPAVFGSGDLKIDPVALPAQVIAPYLRDELLTGMIERSQATTAEAERRLLDAKAGIQQAKDRMELFAKGELTVPAVEPLFQDHFTEPRPQVWSVKGGEWVYESGHVTQKQPVTFPTMVANVSLPRDFAGRIQYRTLETGQIHSVGFFFDATADLRDCQAIYTATDNKKASVQAFHRAQGTEHYPAAGIFPCDLQLNQTVSLDFAMRGQQLNVWLNGVLKLVYAMPTPRRDGSFALWTHSGSAEFYELRFQPLPNDFSLATTIEEKTASPLEPPTIASLEKARIAAENAALLLEKQLAISHSEAASLEARIAADRSKATTAQNSTDLAKVAAKSGRLVAVAKAELELWQAEQALLITRSASAGSSDSQKKTVTDAEAKAAVAKQAVEAARAGAEKEDTQYTSLGPTYPAVSSGRRSSLARWIASSTNPRTSRVAVNHVWLRHFGEGLVPSVANFGLNGRPPSHPELLDWLASDFVDHGWSMKQLHRQLVTSATYGLSSAAPIDSPNQSRDADNRWLWRMNTRRVESEVVRDSVLHVAGELDLAFSGAEIPESAGLESRRRSLYFRSTPNEKMTFLELFDQANPNECYRRQESVVPQQSLALFNSSLSLEMARKLAKAIALEAPVTGPHADAERFIEIAFEQLLSRSPTEAEQAACRRFFDRHAQLVQDSSQSAFPAANPNVAPSAKLPLERAAENLVHVLLNHNDFVTVR